MGADEGACNVPELPDELGEFELPGDLDEPAVLAELDGLADLAELDEFEEWEPPAVEWLEFATGVCAEPGSATATAPAATTLAKLTVAVVALRRRLPRSRSATAWLTLRAAPSRLRRSGRCSRWNTSLLMLSVWHTQLDALFRFDLRTL